MKKGVRYLLGLIACFLIMMPIQTVFAEKDNNNLVQDITFNEATRMFSFKTSPDADVYINSVASRLTADENGHFSYKVPAELKKEKITVIDFLTNESHEFTYDFTKKTSPSSSSAASSNTAASSTSETSSGANQQSEPASTAVSSSQEMSSQSESMSLTSNQSISSTADANQKNTSSHAAYFWAALLVVLILAAAGILFALRRKPKKRGRHRRK